MRRSFVPVLAAALLAASLAHAADPKAAPKKKPAVEAAGAAPPGALERLKSGDAGQIKSALDDVRMAGKAAQGAAPAVADLLERGLTPELTTAAIETLGDLEAESASKALTWYAVHRSPAIRQAAVKALIKTKGAAAEAALRHALSDSDAVVRGTAATGLGALKAKGAVRDLFVALDHKVGEAAASIGQLCAPAECDELAGKLGKLPFDVVTGGLDQILFRPPAEIDDDQKVKLVGRVRELGTSEANRFLRDVQGRWPKTWSPRVKTAIDQGVLATGAGAGAGQ
jgi:HEAT repeat protein